MRNPILFAGSISGWKDMNDNSQAPSSFKTGLAILVIFLMAFPSCSRQVVRTDASEQLDLSGNWNDTDSHLVAEHVIAQLIEDPWHRTFTYRHERKPIVQLGKFRNLTMEHIDVESFVNDIEAALVNSDTLSVVASGKARSEVREERKDYEKNQEHPAGTRILPEKQPDFILRGVIHSQIDEVKDTTLVFYQVDVEMIGFTNNQKIWKTQKKIKKIVKKQVVGW